MPNRSLRCSAFDRPSLLVFAALLAASLSLASSAEAKPRIVPLRTNASFSAQFSNSHWSVPIKSTDGYTVYILSLEPDVFNTEATHFEGLDLILHHPNDRVDSPNLLSSIKNWHGVQNFMFPAWDFKHGVDGSLYGKMRTISVLNLGLVVHITVSKAVVSQFRNNYQLDELNLQIEVDNAAEESKASERH